MKNKIIITREEIKKEINLFADSIIKEYNLDNPYKISKLNTLLNRIDKILKDVELNMTVDEVVKENE